MRATQRLAGCQGGTGRTMLPPLPPPRVHNLLRTQRFVTCAAQPGVGLQELMHQYKGLVVTPSSSKPKKQSNSSDRSMDSPPSKQKQTTGKHVIRGKSGSSPQKQKAANGSERGTKDSSSISNSSKKSPGAKHQLAQVQQQKKKAAPESAGASTSSKDKPAGAAAVAEGAAGAAATKSHNLLPITGKGYGSLPVKGYGPLPSSAAAGSSTSGSSTSGSSTSGSSSSGSSSHGSLAASRSSGVLKLFRFGVEAAAVEKAVQACGWQGRVEQVDAIAAANILLAVKNTAGGRHQNLAQGERAAANAGIPFVIVGRRMTRDSLHKALSPYLNRQSPEQAAAAAEQARKVAEQKAVADAWFSSAAAARWGRPPATTAAAAGSYLASNNSSSSSSSSRGKGPGSRGQSR